MTKVQKRETFVYEGLGFPVKLVNVPMREVFGELAIDINFNVLQKVVLHMLATSHSHLSGKEIRFIIDYFEMSYRTFAKLFGVSHVAVVKWVKEESRMSVGTEICLRLYILNYLNVSDAEFRESYVKICPENLSNATSESFPLEIDADLIAC